MKYFMFSIRDSAAGLFNRPFYFPAVGQAERSFRDEVNRVAVDNIMYSHPEHFDLFIMGTFDEESGAVVGREPELMFRGKDCIRQT